LQVIIGRWAVKKCKKCNIKIDTNHQFCPLCYSDLEQVSNKETTEMFKDPKTLQNKNNKLPMVAKVFLILSVIAMIVCVYTNIKTHTIAWSAVVGLAILYVWVLVCHTILSTASPFKKVFVQLAVVVAFLFTTNFVFSSNDWLSNYVFPGLAMLVSVVLSLVVVFYKHRKRIIFSFFSIIILLALVSGAFLIFKVCNFTILNEIAIIVEGCLLLAYLIFGGKTIRTLAIRKFHL
jgi:hypothetical protein